MLNWLYLEPLDHYIMCGQASNSIEQLNNKDSLDFASSYHPYWPSKAQYFTFLISASHSLSSEGSWPPTDMHAARWWVWDKVFACHGMGKGSWWKFSHKPTCKFVKIVIHSTPSNLLHGSRVAAGGYSFAISGLSPCCQHYSHRTLILFRPVDEPGGQTTQQNCPLRSLNIAHATGKLRAVVIIDKALT